MSGLLIMADRIASKDEYFPLIRLKDTGDERRYPGRAELARMRQGIGKRPGDIPELWGMLFADVPEEMEGKWNEPAGVEWAVYTALTLYVLHQQGRDIRSECMNGPWQGLRNGPAYSGKAIRRPP